MDLQPGGATLDWGISFFAPAGGTGTVFHSAGGISFTSVLVYLQLRKILPPFEPKDGPQKAGNYFPKHGLSLMLICKLASEMYLQEP